MSEVTDSPRSQTAQQGASDQGSFIWYELMTPDPSGARAFYEAVVSWSIGEPIGGPVEYRIIGRDDGGSAGGMLTLTDDMAEHGAHPTWLGYICVDDVDSTVRSIETAGGKSLMPATDIPQGRIAMVADPQGAPIYVMKPTPPADQPDAKSDVFSPSEVQRVAWNELATSDQKSALQFYTSQFGWTAGDTMPMGDMGDYQFIMRGEVMLGAIMTAASENPTRWRFYFRVPDVDAAKSAVESGGGTVLHGPQEVPGGERVLISRDPQGAEFGVVGK